MNRSIAPFDRLSVTKPIERILHNRFGCPSGKPCLECLFSTEKRRGASSTAEKKPKVKKMSAKKKAAKEKEKQEIAKAKEIISAEKKIVSELETIHLSVEGKLDKKDEEIQAIKRRIAELKAEEAALIQSITSQTNNSPLLQQVSNSQYDAIVSHINMLGTSCKNSEYMIERLQVATDESTAAILTAQSKRDVVQQKNKILTELLDRIDQELKQDCNNEKRLHDIESKILIERREETNLQEKLVILKEKLVKAREQGTEARQALEEIVGNSRRMEKTLDVDTAKIKDLRDEKRKKERVIEELIRQKDDWSAKHSISYEKTDELEKENVSMNEQATAQKVEISHLNLNVGRYGSDIALMWSKIDAAKEEQLEKQAKMKKLTDHKETLTKLQKQLVQEIKIMRDTLSL